MMSFVFKELTVSGANQGVEGTSFVINEIVDAMTTAGWSIEDDRRSQAGTTNTTTTHKVVMINNGGETGQDANIYITLVSGNSATLNSNLFGAQLHTAYDVNNHLVPAGGIKNPDTTTSSLLKTTATDSNGYTNLWVAVDKDAMIVMTNSVSTVDSILAIGRSQRFMEASAEPYGAYIYTAASFTINTTNAAGIVGNNPPQNLISAEGEFLITTLATTTQPRTGLGQSEAVWSALPVLFVADDASPIRKGVIGYVRHIFTGTTQLGGLPRVGKLIVSQTGQEFRVFGQSPNSTFLRAS